MKMQRRIVMSPTDRADLGRGAALFNAGHYWHAHEAWEEVWRRHRGSDAHVFFKGLIQLAAAHHQREQGRHRGMLTHFARVRAKLAPFAPAFAGIAVTPLLESVSAGEREAARLGPARLGEFDRRLVPVIDVQ